MAAQTDRLVLIYFCSDACPACRLMEQQVFSQPQVTSALQADYVPVKVNVDYFPATSRQYGVAVWPTVVAVTPDGQAIDRIQGAVDGRDLVSRLGQVASAVRRPAPEGYVRIDPEVSPGAAAPAQSWPPGAPPAAQAYGYPPQAQPSTEGYGYPRQTQPAEQPHDGGYARGLAVRPVLGGQQPTAGLSAGPGAPGAAPPAPVGAPGFEGGPAIGGGPPLSAGRPDLAGPPAYAAATGRGPDLPPAVGGVPAIGGGAAVGRSEAAPYPPDVQQGPAPARPRAYPPLGLDGFCPVRLCETQKWEPGDRYIGAVHRGRTYLFAGEAERRKFFADPDRYAPVMGGQDVVKAIDQGQQVAGRREHGVFFGNRVYLFADEDSLEKFSRDPDHYANRVLQAMRGRTAPAGPAAY